MTIHIAPGRFETGHKKFLQRMVDYSDGIPFTNFQHSFLVEDEIEYKKIVYGKAKDALNLGEWKKWLKTPGKIIHVTKNACLPGISRNLLYHQKGFKGSSEKALYQVETSREIKGLEEQLLNFFHGESVLPTEFDRRFDSFANYLRQNSLGCNWRFVAYLAFLLSDDFYFPILPSTFDNLLDFYGIGQKISGYVSWERYALLLDLAELLKQKLAIYGPANMIEIQSYMWVVARLTESGAISPDKADVREPNFAAELAARQKQAQERERIGLKGEEYIYQQEKLKLSKAGCKHLVDQVQLVSQDFSNKGYDVLSFTPDEQELHIEVKTTTSSKKADMGFWLTANEKEQGAQDPRWCIYRVWNIDVLPEYEDLGNLILQPSKEWNLTPTMWYVSRQS